MDSFFHEDRTVTRERDERALRYCFSLFLKLANWPPNTNFQLDKASSHYENKVKQCLDQKLANKRIGKEGSFSWSPSSLGVAPGDFSFSVVL